MHACGWFFGRTRSACLRLLRTEELGVKMTMNKLASAICRGWGSGVGSAYQPFIQITRRTSSPCSNLCVAPVPGQTRLAHYLSRGEREFALFLWWLGAEDVREQYPLWPWPHVHPTTQLGGSDQICMHRGMSAIAESAGIRLRKYPGLDVHVVLTIDLLVTVSVEINPARLVGISCKPRSVVEACSPTDRALERLELDRRYCVEGGFGHHVAHPEELPKPLTRQLHWLAPIEDSDALSELTSSAKYRSFIDQLSTSAYDRPVWVASAEAAKKIGWSKIDEQRATKIALWLQDLDADISTAFSMTEPLRPGGVAYRATQRAHWLGQA